MSDAQLVKEFTSETGTIIPEKPQVMTKIEVYFLIRMMLDEIMELGASVSKADEVKCMMISMINNSKNIPKEVGNTYEIIASQADALIDCYYYSLDAAAKKGVNLSSIFQVVHKSNMDKKDPITGKFIRREDGKIMKTEGWIAPDIVSEIYRQSNEDAWK